MNDQTVSDPTSGLQLSNGIYDKLKFLVQIILPALAVLYTTLSGLWGFPYAKEVAGTIGAIALFLGVILRISSASYSDSPTLKESTPETGTYSVTQDIEGKKTITIGLDQDPEAFLNKQDIAIRFSNSEVEPDRE